MQTAILTAPAESPDRMPKPRIRHVLNLGVVALLQAMERHGYSRESYDFYDGDFLLPTDDELAEYFRKTKPTVIGIAGPLSCAYQQVKRFARIARDICPDAWIVVGGHVTSAANVIIAKTDADICVIADGEIPWVEFIKYTEANGREWNFEELGKIKGLVYNDAEGELRFNGFGARVPNTQLAIPDYDMLKMGMQDQDDKWGGSFISSLFGRVKDDYWVRTHPLSEKRPDLPNLAVIPTSKGCVARCTFCQRTFKGYQTVEIKQLEDHIKHLQEEFKVGAVHFLDENFGSDRKFARELAKMLKKHDVLWAGGGTRVSSINTDDMEFFRENNCVGFTFGAEAGCQRTLDVMEKRFTKEEIYETFKACIDLDMMSPLNFMTGLPGESEETATETGRFVGEIAYLIGIHPRIVDFTVTYALPFPGTPLYEYCQQVGIIGTSVDDEEEYLIRMGYTRANKANYLNSNGAPASEVLFWDVLMAMEASRTYRRLQRKNPRNPRRVGEQITKRYHEIRQDDREIDTSFFLNRWRRQFHVHVMDSPIIDSLPRFIAYPAIKYLFYCEHLLKKVVKKALGQQYTFCDRSSKVRIPDSYFKDRPARERSLRYIVQSNRSKEPPTKYEQLLLTIRQGELN